MSSSDDLMNLFRMTMYLPMQYATLVYGVSSVAHLAPGDKTCMQKNQDKYVRPSGCLQGGSVCTQFTVGKTGRHGTHLESQGCSPARCL